VSFNAYPEYNSYLAYIVTKSSNADIDTRRMAGIQLKNNLKNHFNNIQLVVLDYVKQCCIEALDYPQPPLCKTVSGIITAIVGRGQVHNWHQVILVLIQKLDDTNPIVLNVSYFFLIIGQLFY
jgi:transportin-1